MSSPRPIILTAIPVAFDERSGGLSDRGNRQILEKCAASGVDGAFILGTTGEFPSLERAERLSLLALSLDILKHKRVVVHVGAPSLFQALAQIEDARAAGAKEVAAITPYFLPATDDAIRDYYRGVSEAADGLGVFVYLFAARTGLTVSPELMAEIAGYPNIIGVKISGESLATVGRYRALLPDDFLVLTGSDKEIGRLDTVGANGVISGIASVYPEPFVVMADAVETVDDAARKALQPQVDEVVDGLLGDIERLKAGLRRQGIEAGYARMAVGRPDAATETLLDSLHARYGTA